MMGLDGGRRGWRARGDFFLIVLIILCDSVLGLNIW
jgi:hypothetical protein